MMSLFKTITQGGQVHLHQLRMLRQILSASLLGAFLAGSGYFIYHCLTLPPSLWRAPYEVLWAKAMLSSAPQATHKNLWQHYTSANGKTSKRKCLSILKDPLLKQRTNLLKHSLRKGASHSFYGGGGVFILILLLWFVMGRLQKQPHHRRGNTFMAPSQLKRLIIRKGEVSDLTFGTLPLIKNKETSHFLITGTTGSGKTNAFHILMPQIRARGDRAIVLDATGDYVSRYYQESTDFILNPLDTRSQAWHPWADCLVDSHYDVFAEAIIQSEHTSKDPFWDNASRALLKTALRKYAFYKTLDIKDLYHFLLTGTDREFENFFQETEAASFAFKNNEKTTHSIRSVLSSHIEGLRHLENSEEVFSIRKWIAEDTSRVEASRGWLFLTVRPDQRATLRPLLSAWMDIAINSLMTLPQGNNQRLWFVMDELTALHRLPRLQTGLAEARKYGGCFLVGFQSKPQLEEIYGRSTSDAMLDLFNTKIFFRCTEPSTQGWISKVLGDKEEEEPQENISFGAHHMRDGVSLSHQIRHRPLIMPAELSQLQDLECYLKYPGNYPCTKIQTDYQVVPLQAEAFFEMRDQKQKTGPPLQQSCWIT